MEITTKELAARNRRAFLASVDAYLWWGMSEAEKAETMREDAEYLERRRAEIAALDRKVEDELTEERIFERMRAQDRAFG